MDVESCLYHDNKHDFGLLQKDLQRSGWIPRKCVHRLAMAVCSCRKNIVAAGGADTLVSQKETLKKIYEEEKSTLPKTLVIFLDRCLNIDTETDYSSGQLIAVLESARHGDFSMLSRAVLSTNSKVSERDLQREINRNKKLTSVQRTIIRNKKRNKMDSCVIKLPVFPGNFPKLKLDKGEFVEPENRLNNENFEANKAEMFVKIWGDSSHLQVLKQRLLEESRRVQKQMDNERRVRIERRQQRRTYLSCFDNEEEEQFGFDYLKEDLTDDFSLKAKKSAKNKSKTATVKVQTSVLDGGHCLQCFKSFTDLHDDKSACTFHKGYIVSQDLSNTRIWSCCSLEVEEDLDAYTAHSTTGCSKSVVHNWRKHAKSKGKDREKEGYQSLKNH